VVNGTVEWLFAFPDRLSVTISAADRLLDVTRETLARQIWEEVAAIARLPNLLPPWQIVRERRATFAATPAENAKRPGAQTAWSNLFLAGDWTGPDYRRPSRARSDPAIAADRFDRGM
jgi:uncharacterized protein with NAD-binding domain and iron-sulfur cluster